MKLILSNFLENFQEWKEKIAKKDKEYLDNIVSDIEDIINSNDTSADKATELVSYFQNMEINYFNALFEYNALEYKLITRNFNDKSLSNYLYMDFRKDLEDLEEKNIKDSIDDNRDFNALGLSTDNKDIKLKLFKIFSKWDRASIISELISSDNNGVWSDRDNIAENGRPATTNELISNLISMIDSNEAWEDYLDNSSDDSNTKQILEILSSDSILDLNDRLVDEFTEDNGVIYMMISNYLVYYVPNEGWGYFNYDKDYSNIDEVIQNSILDEPTIDLAFTNELLGKIDFSNPEDYSDIYAVVDEYVTTMVDPSVIDQTYITNNVLNKKQLIEIFELSSNIYAHGSVIVNFLYEKDNETHDKFSVNYPWKESFDDIMNELLNDFNSTFQELSKHNSDLVESIVNIEEINNKVTLITDQDQNFSMNENLLNFDSTIKKLSSFLEMNNLTSESWNTIYVNEIFRELYTSLFFQFNYAEKNIKNYMVTQINTDY